MRCRVGDDLNLDDEFALDDDSDGPVSPPANPRDGRRNI
jgi:hypothetical protein